MHIRLTLSATKHATYSIDLPEARLQGMPRPTGTGFFISADGWFATAAHVITENGEPDGPVRQDVGQAWLKRAGLPGMGGGMCQFPNVEWVCPEIDFALLKCDFAANSNKHHLQGLAGFPHLTVSARQLDEGEPVYAFGYPLSAARVVSHDGQGSVIGFAEHSPRVTSAIVSSNIEHTRMVVTGAEPAVYVLDKALNYGNSGGPILAQDNGHVHGWCSRFQPLQVPQGHLKDASGNMLTIMIPSLYGIVGSFATPGLREELEKRGITVVDS